MSGKLLPCPFCGSTDLEILPKDPSRDGNAWGAVQCVNVDCPTYDILKSHGVRVGDGQDVSDERGSDAYKSAAIAAWNRRTPAPEGEAVCNETGTTPDIAGLCRSYANTCTPSQEERGLDLDGMAAAFQEAANTLERQAAEMERLRKAAKACKPIPSSQEKTNGHVCGMHHHRPCVELCRCRH